MPLFKDKVSDFEKTLETFKEELTKPASEGPRAPAMFSAYVDYVNSIIRYYKKASGWRRYFYWSFIIFIILTLAAGSGLTIYSSVKDDKSDIKALYLVNSLMSQTFDNGQNNNISSTRAEDNSPERSAQPNRAETNSEETPSTDLSAATDVNTASAATSNNAVSAATDGNTASAATSNNAVSAATDGNTASAATSNNTVSAATDGNTASAATGDDIVTAKENLPSMRNELADVAEPPAQGEDKDDLSNSEKFKILSDAIKDATETQSIMPPPGQSGLIFLALSGGLFWVMRFCGLPGSWIRVNATQHSLQTALNQYCMAYAKLMDIHYSMVRKSQSGSEDTTNNSGAESASDYSDNTLAVYTLIEQLNIDISSIVADETEEWASKLRESVNNLKLAIERTKAAATKSSNDNAGSANDSTRGRVLLKISDWDKSQHSDALVFIDDKKITRLSTSELNLGYVQCGERVLTIEKTENDQDKSLRAQLFAKVIDVRALEVNRIEVNISSDQ